MSGSSNFLLRFIRTHLVPSSSASQVICYACLFLLCNPNLSAQEGNQKANDSKILQTVKTLLDGFTIEDTHILPYLSLEGGFDPFVGLKLQHPSIWASSDKMNHHFKYESATEYSWKFRYLANSLSTEKRKLSFLFKLKADEDTYFYGIGNSTQLSERAPATYSSVFFGAEYRQNLTDSVVGLWSPGFWQFQSGLVEGGEFERSNDARYITSRLTLNDKNSLDFWKGNLDNQWSAYIEMGLPIDTLVSSYARFNLQSSTQFPLFKNSKFRVETRFEYIASPNRDLIPYFALPEIGSNNGLRGFSKERFRNFTLVGFNFEYAWPFTDQVDGFLLFDVARTGKNPTQLLDEESHNSLGIGIRFHNTDHPISVGIAASNERFKIFSNIAVGSAW